MKKKESKTGMVKDLLLLGAFTAAKVCMDRIEEQKRKDDKDPQTLQRKLTVISIVYHAIGIFYNE